MAQKRPLEHEGPSAAPEAALASSAKRARTEQTSIVAIEAEASATTALIKSEQAPARTSKMQAPIMMLEGHTGPVYTVAFASNGQSVATAGKDRNILLWGVYGECTNHAVLSGHKNAILQVKWGASSGRLVAACADKTVALWDVNDITKLRTWKGHTGIVNSVDCTTRGPLLAVSGSDDGAVRLWDARSRGSVHTHTRTLPTSVPTPLPVTAVAMGAAGDAEVVYFGGVGGDIVKYDVRAGKVLTTLTGHTGVVTGLSVGQDGDSLASHAADGTVRVWDVRPFSGDASTSILGGAAAASAAGVHPRQRAALGRTAHSAERLLHRVALSPDGTRVAAGSADETVYVWHTTPDAETAAAAGTHDPRLQYALPGHTGAVTDVAWSPLEPILASASTDGKVYLGEVRVQ